MNEPYFQHNGVTIYCSDCLDVMSASLSDGSIDLIATSPVFNCRKKYDACYDEIPWPAYYRWIGRILDECYRVLRPGGTLAVNVPGVVRYQHDHEHHETWSDFDPTYETHRMGEKVLGRGRIEPVGFNLLGMMSERDPHIREPIVWVKGKQEGEEFCTKYQMGSDNNPHLRPAHEFILLGSKERWFHRGGTGRRGAKAVPFLDYTKDVWYILPESDNDHPAVWPAEIPRRLIRLFVHAEDAVVLDPFMGRGTTLREAKGHGVNAVGIDISENYCRRAVDDLRQDFLFSLANL